MPIELESKVRVSSHEPIQERLRASGATYIGRVLETNRILDREDGALREAGCGLRVRSITVLDGQCPGPTLTFKGPRQKSAFKQREELEVSINDAKTMTAILVALGYRERIMFEKRRESWRLGECHVELDEVPLLGKFVEVEGPTETAIGSVLDQLELSDQDLISRGYVGMLAQRVEREKVPSKFCFES